MKFDREELAEILSRSRHPMRWEYAATSNIQDEDYAQADAVIAHYTEQERTESRWVYGWAPHANADKLPTKERAEEAYHMSMVPVRLWRRALHTGWEEVDTDG